MPQPQALPQQRIKADYVLVRGISSCVGPRLLRVVGSMAVVCIGVSSMLHAQAPPCPPPNAHISIDSGTYGPQPGVTFRLRHFTGTLTPQGHSAPLCYLKQTLLTRAEIYASDDSLTEVFASKLDASGSKIKDFKVTNVPGQVTLSGKIVKVIPINFSVKGTITTDGSLLLLHADKIDADGIPVKALLGMIGEHLSAVLNMRGVGGVSVEDNTIRFAPEKIAHLIGHIQSVESMQSGLILRYSSVRSAPHRSKPAAQEVPENSTRKE